MAVVRNALFAAFDRRVGSDEVSVVRDMVGEKCAQPLDIVAPVAVQFAGNAEPVISCAPAADMRSHAECRVISSNVPEASVTTNTS